MIQKSRARLLALALLAMVSACGDSPADDVILPPLERDPVLFVHGFGGSANNFAEMIARFRARGYRETELYAYNYSFLTSNATTAEEIRAHVNQVLSSTGAEKVDIVAFSMGSLSSRYYLKNLGGHTRVDAWVSLAGPNHGTDAADNCRELTPCREMLAGSSFLAALNAGDETPGLVRYATWRSPCDTTINPDESVVLAGATNNLTACIPHIGMVTDATVFSEVASFID